MCDIGGDLCDIKADLRHIQGDLCSIEEDLCDIEEDYYVSSSDTQDETLKITFLVYMFCSM